MWVFTSVMIHHHQLTAEFHSVPITWQVLEHLNVHRLSITLVVLTITHPGMRTSSDNHSLLYELICNFWFTPLTTWAVTTFVCRSQVLSWLSGYCEFLFLKASSDCFYKFFSNVFHFTNFCICSVTQNGSFKNHSVLKYVLSIIRLIKITSFLRNHLNNFKRITNYGEISDLVRNISQSPKSFNLL